MSSASSLPLCALDLRASKTLSLILAGLMLLGAGSAWYAGLPAWLAVPFAILTGLPGLRVARGEVTRLAWQPDGRWLLRDRRGKQHEAASLLPGIHLGGYHLALHWRCNTCGRRFRAVMLFDNCDSNALRRLQVRLRWSSDAELFGDQSAH